jgi:toxin-antitoxin system PIN domain toxin
VILVDADLLLYAYDSSSPQHQGASEWLEATFNGGEQVALALVTLLAFVRISSNPAAFHRPLPAEDAIAFVSEWLELPNVSLVGPTERHWSVLADVARKGQARGAMVMDAHLAALAIEHGATLFTTDRDFSRFRSLRAVDPLAI